MNIFRREPSNYSDKEGSFGVLSQGNRNGLVILGRIRVAGGRRVMRVLQTLFVHSNGLVVVERLRKVVFECHLIY